MLSNSLCTILSDAGKVPSKSLIAFSSFEEEQFRLGRFVHEPKRGSTLDGRRPTYFMADVLHIRSDYLRYRRRFRLLP